MSESNIQLPSGFNLNNKNFQIPHPVQRKGNIDNYKNILNANNMEKKIRNYKINKNLKYNEYNSQIENGGNNIFDSLINLSKPQKNEYNYIDNGEETNSIDNKLFKVKRDMEDVKKNINKLNKKMINIKNNSEQLEINKSNYENELINLISNSETLEEMYNTEIAFIKNGKFDNSYGIQISKEEIQNININKFINQIITLIKIMNNDNKEEEEIESSNLYFNSLFNYISQIHSNFINQLRNKNNDEKAFSRFFSSLYEIILDELNEKYPFNVINSLLHYIIKFNIINEQIKKCENFVEMEYKIQKEKINEEMIELTMALIFYENHKHEILNLTSKIQDEINEQKKIKENSNLIKDNHIIDSYERDTDYVNLENIHKKKEIINFNNRDNKDFEKSINESILREKNKNKIKLGIPDITIEKISKGNNLENKKKKRQIYENYLNNGIRLNESKNKKNQIYLNSISEYNNKTNISYNYNFNTNFVDIKPIERKIENKKKNILTIKNVFNLNNQRRKKYNSNASLNEFNTNPVDKNIETKDIKINRILTKNAGNKININFKKILNNLTTKKNINKPEANNLFKYNKTTISNDEKPITTYKKGNLNNNKILNTKAFLSKNHKNNSSMKNIQNKISNTNLILNINNNIKFNSKDTNRIKKRLRNSSNLLTNEIKDININLNKLFELKEKDNNINKIYKGKKITKTSENSKNKDLNIHLKSSKKAKMESFCYFKFLKINDNTKKFNPLNVCSINPEYFDYYECYISIDYSSGSLKISPKISLEKIKYLPFNNKKISLINNLNNSIYIEMKLKDITSVKLEKYAKDIIQIQNILLKNKIKANNNFSINKLLNIKEIKDIKIEQSEKIKAALCNFFPFSFVIENNIKLDLVFINYEQFDIWLRNLKSIAYNNLKFSKIGKSYTNDN